MKTLEIGPGDYPLEGCDTLDAAEGATYRACWGSERLPIPDRTYNRVYASHVIEHVPWYQTLDALREVHRILKPLGTFEVHTVDFGRLVACYQCRASLDEWTCGGRNEPFHWMRWIASRLFAYEKDGNAYQWHKALFDEAYLRDCLTEAGFVDIQRSGKPQGHDHGVIDLGMHCRKPAYA